MKIGIQIPYFTYPGSHAEIPDHLESIVKTVDSGGFDSLWVMDHYFQIQNLFELEYTEPMFEGYSLLNYFAGLTKNIKLGALVTGIIYRNPAFLVKQVTALDVLSKGRAYFGIGAAWYKEEAEAYGFPYPSVKVRFEMLEENLKIAKQMFSDNNDAFHGKHYNLGETQNSPQPTQKPHPPIMIGGMGEQKTLRMVAQYADACNLFAAVGIKTLKHKLSILRKHCESLGRNYSEIEKTSLGTVKLTQNESSAKGIIQHFKELADIGIEHAIVNMPNVHEISPLETMRDEVLPVVIDL
ncbi:MAG: LLM class F420-dependent oxidoreductase [Candidatus Heimdallarchaeota archaeon]|nr:LLM class F420-dependent oxidoreductase [Candidatus Heimdallarchaeota archaeon]